MPIFFIIAAIVGHGIAKKPVDPVQARVLKECVQHHYVDAQCEARVSDPLQVKWIDKPAKSNAN